MRGDSRRARTRAKVNRGRYYRNESEGGHLGIPFVESEEGEGEGERYDDDEEEHKEERHISGDDT